MTDIPRKVGVVGLGVMGFDIAFLYAMNGFQTVVYDASKAVMDSLSGRRKQTIDRLQKRNRISDAETENVRKLLTPLPDLGGLAQSNLITEAVSENAKTKLAVYRALRDAGFSGILTTNTSSVTRATLLATGDYDRRKFALTHFFNPVLYTQMVEVVKGDMAVTHGDAVISFLNEIGRQPVETKDISGFVSNGILMVYAVMALRLLECGARVEQVDQAAKELKVLPPLISFDSWKPSIVEDVTHVMFELRGDEFLRSSKLLTRLAKDNPTFYVDRLPNPKIYELAEAHGRSLDDESVKRALQTCMVIAAARVAELGESPATVDFVATEGIKMPQPPLKGIDEIGLAAVLDDLKKTNLQLGDQPMPVPALLSRMAEEKQTFYKNDQTNPWLLAHAGRTQTHASH
ncbi:MAG TPA: 3-hydroxyacyl-CoA dehydrogenase NAD-binding domain-containing protein [Candidatus Binatia bacterium]|jgi:3-hydroxybutyryl-CoA dehydrogenase|nr:3-hydroxyacyl-CoA dehydrogenase NAD-binding domain-containing protein [Candidatus Binatia bacterium]